MKQKIRRDILSKRNNHSHEEKSRKDEDIMNKLFCLPEFVKAKNILFYVSVKGEVCTENIISETMKRRKRVFIPISDVMHRNLSVSELGEVNKELVPGAFGIPEPSYPILADPESLDLIIIACAHLLLQMNKE